MTATPAWPRQVAISAALEDHAPLMALLAGDGIHSGQAPAGAPMDYVVLGSTNEKRDDVIMTPGHEGLDDFACVSADVTKFGVQAMYSAIVDALDGQILPLTGHIMIRCRVEYVTDYGEPDGKARRLIGRVRTLTQVAS